MVTIDSDDSVEIMAQKIFCNFELLQCCTISGFERDGQGEFRLEEKGKLVCDRLSELDVERNYHKENSGRYRRKRVKLANCIGGFVAQKIFRWDRRIADSDVKYTIWRIQ